MQTKPQKRLWIWSLVIGIALSAIILAQFGDTKQDIVIRNDADYYRLLQEAEKESKEILEKLIREEELTERDKEQLIPVEKQLHALVQYAPQNFAPYLHLGMIYYSYGHMAAAEQHLRRCIQYTPPLTDNQAVMDTQAEAHYQLSRVLNARERYEEAAAESSIAIQQNPNNVNYYIGRSISFSQMKQPELARMDLQAALKLDPNNSKARSLLKFLDRSRKKSP